jgi:putative membrane protein insertion efficiency factor
VGSIRPQGVASALMPFGVIAARHFATKHGPYLLARAQESQDAVEGDEEASEESKVKEEEPLISAAAIGAIGFYKSFISPLLPPACRFVPTCSQYGVQAIKEYGPSKGGILIAWRLLRCSPVGGKGYDPPKWPPVSYTYSSY